MPPVQALADDFSLIRGKIASRTNMRNGSVMIRTLVYLAACSIILVAPAYAGGSAQPSNKPVLDPTKIPPPMNQGYFAAQKYPEACSKVFCYCGCDVTARHKCLLDCYTSDHGKTCGICMLESVEVKKQKDKGAQIDAVRKQVDKQFAHYYPFTKPTKALRDYRASLTKAPDGIK